MVSLECDIRRGAIGSRPFRTPPYWLDRSLAEGVRQRTVHALPTQSETCSTSNSEEERGLVAEERYRPDY